MLQQSLAEDYVIATGVQHSVRDFVDRAAQELGIDIEWSGTGSDERGVVRAVPADSLAKPGQCIVAIDSRYFRPAEVESLLGDASKAREKLGWMPATSFETLVREMVTFDLDLAKRDALTHSAGFRTPAHHE